MMGSGAHKLRTDVLKDECNGTASGDDLASEQASVDGEWLEVGPKKKESLTRRVSHKCAFLANERLKHAGDR